MNRTKPTKVVYQPNPLEQDLVRTFNTPHGLRALEGLERRAYSKYRIDTPPKSDEENPAFVNPNAALYRSAQLDQLQYIKRVLKKHGADIKTLDDESQEKSLTD